MTCGGGTFSCPVTRLCSKSGVFFNLLLKSCSSKGEVLGWWSKPKSEVFVLPVIIYPLCAPGKSSQAIVFVY